IVLPGYLELFFSAPSVRQRVIDLVKSTSGQKGISGQDLKALSVTYPSLSEQTEIVRRVEQLFAFANQLEAKISSAQLRIDCLTQSLLAKAFSGELTADWRAANPHLISGKNSVNALLEEIKSERKLKQQKRKSRTQS
ncbi:restriction endonuclease subunit S, partial [Pseudomonas aeruginosa]